MAGQIVRRGGRSWLVRIFVGREAGKRRYLNRTVRGTRKDAERVLTRLLRDRDTGELLMPSRQPLAEFLNRWLDDYAAGAVAETTMASYRATVRVHLSPALGATPLRNLTPQAIQGYISRKLQGEKDADGRWIERPLSPKTVAYHRTVLREALAHAVRWGLLVRNPADLTSPPRVVRKEMRVLDEEQTKVFLGEAKRFSPYYRLYLAAVLTGARQGELLGWRWSDLNLPAAVASVTRTLYRLGGKMLLKEPKSPKARRSIVLPQVLIVELRTFRAAQEEHRLLTGDCPEGETCRSAACVGWHDFGLVFCQPNGKPLHAHNVAQRDFRRILALEGLRAELRRKGVEESALPKGLPRIRFHDLRHTAATLHLQNGTHPKVVQEMLGHSTISMTLDTYSHVVSGMQEQATRQLEARLFGPNRPNAGVTSDNEERTASRPRQ